MTETISPRPEQIDAQQLAQQLVERARADGVALVGPGGLLTRLTKTVLETALDAELSEHLGYDKHDSAGRNGQNSRNGSRTKTVLTEVGPVEAAGGQRQHDLVRAGDCPQAATPAGRDRPDRGAAGPGRLFAEVYGAKIRGCAGSAGLPDHPRGRRPPGSTVVSGRCGREGVVQGAARPSAVTVSAWARPTQQTPNSRVNRCNHRYTVT